MKGLVYRGMSTELFTQVTQKIQLQCIFLDDSFSNFSKYRQNVFPVPTTKAYRGSRGIAPVHLNITSHKSNPLSIPQGYTDLYPGSHGRCGRVTLLRYTVTHWLTGLWSTQAKVVGIMLKAAWHWGSDSSVSRFPWGTRPYPIVCRPSICGGLRGRTS
jgi:hypothetical protein